MKPLKEKIKEAYSAVLLQPATSCCQPPQGTAAASCCGPATEFANFSEAYNELPGYLPEADWGLGCGIPVAFAGIEKGQTVLDLGSGAGNDVFVARSLVGESGRVIGLDMTPAMINKANENKKKLGYGNVEFVLGEIEHIPLPPESVDIVISNCVINLVPDKAAAFAEIYNVLKTGGHFSISDVVLTGRLTPKMEGLVALYAGCISGAMEKGAYLATIQAAGFQDISIKKEKVISLPDSFLLQHLSEPELADYRASGVQVLSITVNASK
jgi:arsenite methyltransferase